MADLCSLPSDNILITGASGVIGANLVKAIIELRVEGSSNISVVTKSGNFPDIGIDSSRLNIIKGDLLDTEFIQSLPSYDLIFHAAGYGQPAKFLDNQLGTLRLNCEVTGILNSKVRPGGRFIFFSSSEIYSGSTSFPNKEEDIGQTDPYHPRAAYIEGKRVGETVTHLARSAYGISSSSIRIALVYGPGTKIGDTRVLNSFISRSLIEKKLQMLDLGEALRTYCFVEDAIKMILRIAQCGTEQVYNLGGIETVSIRQLGEEIARITGAAFLLPKVDKGLDSAPSAVKLDLTKTLTLFPAGFSFTSLVEGLSKTIDWQREHLH